MISSGSHTDSSFVQSWWQGAQEAQEELGDAADVSWTDGLNSLDALDRAAGAALTEGNEYLLISTSEAPQLVDKYAQRFPDQWVCDIETPRESYPPNVCTMFPRYYEGAFLAGALAGLVTETDKVGAVSAFDIPIQNLQVEAFLLGARYTNPDVALARANTESFIDAGAGRAAAQAQFAAGNDVVLSALDEGTRGIFAAAEANDGLVITQYTDQYDSAPTVVLTSVLYRQDAISKRMIETAVEGALEAKSYDFGLAEIGAGELAPFRGTTGERVSGEAANRIDEIQAAIVDGTLQLPDIATLSKRGSADRVDLASLEG
ncbi:MAG: BMP family ABC transporter substrate-binding protein [Thermoleophilaceae bacterium]